MAEILSMISIIAFVIAGISLGLAVFFWFFFKIPGVIGDLSGRTARKSIARMRADNERTGRKTYQTGAINRERGKVTDTMPQQIRTAEFTTLLDEVEETQLLAETPVAEAKPKTGKQLQMIEDIVLLNTAEVI